MGDLKHIRSLEVRIYRQIWSRNNEKRLSPTLLKPLNQSLYLGSLYLSISPSPHIHGYRYKHVWVHVIERISNQVINSRRALDSIVHNIKFNHGH